MNPTAYLTPGCETCETHGITCSDCVREIKAIAKALSPKAREWLLLAAAGRNVGGAQAAALARKRLVKYVEHGDAWYGGRLTMRREYGATPLGLAVAQELPGAPDA